MIGKYMLLVVSLLCLLPVARLQKSKSDKTRQFDTCVGRCSFDFIETLKRKMGPNAAAGLMDLEFSAIIKAFSNATFLQGFCRVYDTFRQCHGACPLSYLRELLRKGTEVVDLYCVKNYDAMTEKLGCLDKLNEEMSKQCLKSCTSYHDGVTSLLNNFNRLALDGDSTQAERDLGESCEYVTCSLHCDTPSVAFTCGYGTAELLINVTKETFEKIEEIAIGTGAIAKWPAQCADIRTYAMPTPPPLPDRSKVGITTDETNLDQQSTTGAPVSEKLTSVTASATSLRSLLVVYIPFSILSILLLFIQ